MSKILAISDSEQRDEMVSNGYKVLAKLQALYCFKVTRNIGYLRAARASSSRFSASCYPGSIATLRLTFLGRTSASSTLFVILAGGAPHGRDKGSVLEIRGTGSASRLPIS